jgi:septal ring factor EnvC (AmiA/AmiB activator)
MGPFNFEEKVLMVRKIQFEVGALAAIGVAAFALLVSGSAFAASELDQMVAQRMENNQTGATSQKHVDKLSDQTDKLGAEYRAVLQRIEALRVYNRKVSRLITSQEEEIASLRDQIDDVELVSREVTPLMLAMLDAVDNFTQLDIPFLMDERAKRIEALHDVMVNANVTDAERYRRIMEAYQIENEYGRTIETYKAELVTGSQKRQVDYLKIGRVAFLYQTLDGTETGVWDQNTKSWTIVPEYQVAVRQGIRMARKQTAPDLLKLPVPTAEAVK